MQTIVKYAAATALAGVLAIAAAAPSQAQHRWHHNRGAAIGGFVAGAVVGAAVANSANGYYYNDPGYAYEPGYVEDGAYAYEPEPTYGYRSYRYNRSTCAIDQGYGRYDYSGC